MPSVRVLILADAAQRRVVGRMLSEGDPDAAIDGAGLGEEGLSLCREGAPACILLGPALEDMACTEFIERLRAATAGPPPAVIMMSVEERINEDDFATADNYIALEGLEGKELWRRIHHTIQRVRQQAEVLDLQFALSEAQQEMERFGRIVSHDLRAPLFSVSSLCQLLQEHFGDELDDEPAEYLDLMMKSVHQMRQLIGDVLSYFRIPLPQKKPLPLAELIHSVIRDMSAQRFECGGQVEVTGPPAAVYGDQQQIVRLFQGLISFAMQPSLTQSVPGGPHRADPPLSSGVVRPPVLLRISSERLIGGWQISVALLEDSVTAADLERVLEFSSSRLRNHEGEGSGTLGLAVARKIVQLHGGRFWIEPSPERGAVVCFVLPDPPEPQ